MTTGSPSSLSALDSLSAERLDALYSPLKPRNVNPEHYDHKLKFWYQIIEEWVRGEKRTTFTTSDLKGAFFKNGRNVACLPEVIEQMHKNGVIMRKDEFVTYPWGGESWLSWSAKPLKWTAKKLWSFVPLPDISSILVLGSSPPKLATSQLIFPQHVFEVVEVLKSDCKLQQVLSKEKWASIVGSTLGLPAEEIEILFEYMRKRGLLLVDTVGDVIVVKTVPEGIYSSQDGKLSDLEKHTYTLQSAKESLESQVNGIEQEILKAEENAREALRKGNRIGAKSHLKRKKVLEGKGNKLAGIVDNLDVLQSQIEDAQSNSLVIEAFESGKDALVKALKSKDMNPDRIQDIMLDIQDTLEDHAEIKNQISQPILEPSGEGTEDIEAELEALMAADEEEKKKEAEAAENKEFENALNKLEDLNLDGLDKLEPVTRIKKGQGRDSNTAN